MGILKNLAIEVVELYDEKGYTIEEIVEELEEWALSENVARAIGREGIEAMVLDILKNMSKHGVEFKERYEFDCA